MDINTQIQHLAYRPLYDNKTNPCLYKFDYAISKIANEITKIPRTVKKVVSYRQRTFV